MKTYMPLDGFRWSCDSDSALCDIPQTNVLGQAGGGKCAPPSILEIDMISKKLKEQHLQYAFTFISIFSFLEHRT